jgi:hypothetical protein
MPFESRLPNPVAHAEVIEDDRAADGYQRVTLVNDRVSVTLAPDAGARAFSLLAPTDRGAIKNVFTTVGALRDDVAIPLPLSTTDRIGKYTRSFPAGMFNRVYRVEHRPAGPAGASVTLSYDAPDVAPSGAHFERTLTLRDRDPAVTVDAHVTFAAGPNAEAQRAVRYDSFDTRDAATLDERANGAVGFFYPAAHCIAIVAWPPAEVEDARIVPERTSTVLRLQFAPGLSRTRYALEPAADVNAAETMMLKERLAVAANP